MSVLPHIAPNLSAIRRQIITLRPDSGVTLIAVSKTQPVEAIEMAIKAGQRDFGENRVQEALLKFPPLKMMYPDLVLHCLGPLQTNKVRDALALFDVIHTLDRPRLAEAMAREVERTGKRPDCFIEVNTGEEPQKAGILPHETEAFVKLCRDELHLPVVGLMCIPPAHMPAAPHFAFLRKLAGRCGLAQLSMGMSGDFQTAVRLGATHVRVGTAIFGERKESSGPCES